jgi:hypothetical protein
MSDKFETHEIARVSDSKEPKLPSVPTEDKSRTSSDPVDLTELRDQEVEMIDEKHSW